MHKNIFFSIICFMQKLSKNNFETVKNNRILSLDLLRGTIMVLMALDHANYMVTQVHSNEFWGIALPHYNTALSFINRLITHICAPGFFFLMGISMVMFAMSRRQLGWVEFKIKRFLVSRGTVLIILQLFIMFARAMGEILAPDRPAAFMMPGGEISSVSIIPPLFFGVLYALGGVMIIFAFLMHLKSSLIFILSVFVILLTQLITPGPEQASVLFSPLVRLFLIPGQTNFWRVSYPIIPWMGFTGLGLVVGRSLLKNRTQTYRYILFSGIGLFLLFVVIRYIGGFGNFHDRGEGLIDFFNVTKYPPSLAFTFLSLSINFLLLFMYAQIEKRINQCGKFLCVFGRVPLFFYFLHLSIYGLISAVLPDNSSFLFIYLVWVIGLLIMYPLCYAYGQFKKKRSLKSLWKFL